LYGSEDALAEAFRTGAGVGWSEHASTLFDGVVFRPGYEASLVPQWLPALDGVTAKPEAGARVADVTIQLVPVPADAVGWRWAFWLLVPGPLVGVLAMGAFGRQAVRAGAPSTS
jgi:hypothetical protein